MVSDNRVRKINGALGAVRVLNDLQMKALARQIMRASFGHTVKVAQIHITQISAVVLIRFNSVEND